MWHNLVSDAGTGTRDNTLTTGAPAVVENLCAEEGSGGTNVFPAIPGKWDKGIHFKEEELRREVFTLPQDKKYKNLSSRLGIKDVKSERALVSASPNHCLLWEPLFLTEILGMSPKIFFFSPLQDTSSQKRRAGEEIDLLRERFQLGESAPWKIPSGA